MEYNIALLTGPLINTLKRHLSTQAEGFIPTVTKEETHFCRNTKEKVEKKKNEARVVRQFQKEKDFVGRCGRLIVAFGTSTDRDMMCRVGEAHFCIHAKNKVEKKWYEPRVVHDDNNVVCS